MTIQLRFIQILFVNEFKGEAVNSDQLFRVSIFDIFWKKSRNNKILIELSMGFSLKLYIVQFEGVKSNYSKSFKMVKE